MKNVPAADLRRLSNTICLLLNDIRASDSSNNLKDIYNQALKVLLRRFIDKYWVADLCVSKACWAKARADGIADIRSYEPRQLSKTQKPKYHLEHYLPVDDLRSDLLKLQRPTQGKVFAKLRVAPIKKVWVLKKEENKLLKRSNRGDPAEAYKKAGSVVLGANELGKIADRRSAS